MDAERMRAADLQERLGFTVQTYRGFSVIVDADKLDGLADALEAALEREQVKDEALQAMLDLFDRHAGWCGYNKNAPGDGIVNRAPELAREALAAGSSSLRNPTQDDPDALADALNDAQFPDGPFDVPIPGGDRIARGGAARSETEETPT